MNRHDQIDRVARDILKLARNTILVNQRYMDNALSQFKYINNEKYYLATDSKNLYYNPILILKNYKNSQQEIVRNYFHSVLHCVFKHMYCEPSVDREYWNISCDIAIESIINDLGMKSAEVDRVKNQLQVTAKIKDKVKFITAEKTYSYLKCLNLTGEEKNKLSELFYGDDHDIWYMHDDEKQYESNGNSDITNDNGNNNVSPSMLSASEWNEMKNIWSDISKKIKVEMETYGKLRGVNSGGLIQNLLEVTREKYDYAEFLKKFSVMGEVMKINNNEFDYIYYTYGLNLYKKMPLIEPLEYKDDKRIREFVITIDTSGSTSGDLVQTFIKKTYNILKTTESFFGKVNIHIIQCDTEIKEDAKITNDKEFDYYIQHMKIRGLGGTDFRPVFQYVNELQNNKEFRNLKGLIYFTDGFGVFPSKKPNYKTAVVYIDDDFNNPIVPPWVIKLILQRNEI